MSLGEEALIQQVGSEVTCRNRSLTGGGSFPARSRVSLAARPSARWSRCRWEGFFSHSFGGLPKSLLQGRQLPGRTTAQPTLVSATPAKGGGFFAGPGWAGGGGRSPFFLDFAVPAGWLVGAWFCPWVCLVGAFCALGFLAFSGPRVGWLGCVDFSPGLISDLKLAIC